MNRKDEPVACYPEIFEGANAWLWGKTEHPAERVEVTYDGLRHLLRLIKMTQRAVFDASMELSAAGGKMKDGINLPGDIAIKLMNRTSEIFCEDDLIVSGLFVIEDEVVISPSTDVPLLGSAERQAKPAPAGQEQKEANR